MNNRRKDIIILVIMIALTSLSMWYFYQDIDESKKMADTNLYELIPSSPEVVLAINRPLVFEKIILPKGNTGKVFSHHIPMIYQELIRECTDLPAFILSFHAKEVVFYASMSKNKAYQIFKLLDTRSPFKSQQKKQNKINCKYYPDTEQRFLGCYYHEGVFVASHNHKLLEQIAKQQQADSTLAIPELKNILRNANTNAPANLFVLSEVLDLRVQITEITEWKIKEKWLGADIFLSEDKLCCLHTQPYQASLDSLFYPTSFSSFSMWNNTQYRIETLYQCMGDTIESRINQLFPQIKATTQVSHDEAVAYFTICGS